MALGEVSTLATTASQTVDFMMLQVCSRIGGNRRKKSSVRRKDIEFFRRSPKEQGCQDERLAPVGGGFQFSRGLKVRRGHRPPTAQLAQTALRVHARALPRDLPRVIRGNIGSVRPRRRAMAQHESSS